MSDPEQSLEDFLDVENAHSGVFDDVWEPQNDEEAEWAMQMLARAHRELERIQAAADTKREQIDAWQERASVGPLAAAERFEQKLVGYRKRLEREDPHLRLTYPLPSGVIKRRAGATRVNITDEQAFISWALSNDDSAVKVVPVLSAIKGAGYRTVIPKETLKKSDGGVTEVVSLDGEVVPGVEIEVGPPIYGVKPG